MDVFKIKGPCRLNGEVNVSGSKNSALPLIFSSLLFTISHRLRPFKEFGYPCSSLWPFNA